MPIKNLNTDITGVQLFAVDVVKQLSPHNVQKVIYNNPATIVIWDDGTKTVVSCNEGDEYDRKIGLLLCFAKKLFGNGGKYNDVIRKWVTY